MLKPLKKYWDISKLYLALTLSLYLILLIWIVVFKANYSVIPLRYVLTKAMTLKERFMLGCYPYKNLIECDGGDFSIRLLEHFLNIIVFLPFGFLLPFFIKKKTVLFTSLIFIFATIGFELHQLFTWLGGFDVTDLINNTLGGFIGIAIYKLIFSKFSDHAVNRISFVANVIFTPIALFAIYNTIKHFDYYI